MDKNKTIQYIIPVNQLKEAEAIFPETSEIIGPYMHGVRINDFDEFYNDLSDIIERSRGPECIIKDINNVEIIDNFVEICDEIVTALQLVKNQVEYFFPDFTGYEIKESKKIDNESVMITLQWKE